MQNAATCANSEPYRRLFGQTCTRSLEASATTWKERAGPAEYKGYATCIGPNQLHGQSAITVRVAVPNWCQFHKLPWRMYAWTGPLLCIKQLQAGKKAAGQFVASSGGISAAYRSTAEHLKAKRANVELIAKVHMLLVAVWFNGTCSLPQFHQFSSI
jgi:hypothetical protein